MAIIGIGMQVYARMPKGATATIAGDMRIAHFNHFVMHRNL